ncbi:hypothetical protein PtA15_15A446 [Puccinia triticina]|uniref:Glutathione peroxidase n=1 Tax=Puccinia triticina TaxID=208348 RepID=A0ABY7D6T6_9BASI|nr:uncharacterized protein PtA15_15A446 [Puccinia triticina]WAQ92051.1 hypothetical protein PtA15_15A446 [Puccinia triticina]
MRRLSLVLNHIQSSASHSSIMSKFYNLKANLANGTEFDFSQTRGKVVVVVNVASKCGFTTQYEGLEKLWQKFKDKDFQLIGFPCNQFGGQEPGTDSEIASFCKLNYGVTFPIAQKCDVNGDNAHEVYKFLKAEKAGIMGLSRIKWNFEKFVVDKKGAVRYRHASTAKPESLEKEIEGLLAEPAP